MKHFYLAVVVALSGCAMSSGFERGPNGRPVFYVDGMSAAAAYKKADALCPSGYTILDQPKQTSPLDYELSIECKSTSTAQN